MDIEQEQIQFLGFFGIFKESIKVILSHPKIFTKINLAFLLPLTIVTLLNVEIAKNLSNNNSSTLFWVCKVAYFVFAVIFSLLSISAVVYTVACIYTGKDITFKKVLSVIPIVWKRLMITLVSNFCIMFAYFLVSFLVILLCTLIFVFVNVYVINSKPNDIQVGITFLTVVAGIIVTVGVIFISIFWQLANVISVMEKCCGFQAMKKSRQLIKGKFLTAFSIIFVLLLWYVPISLLQGKIRDNKVPFWPKITYGIIILVLNPIIVLYSLVVHSVFYFVCKSYHHENINKSSLAEHLEAFHGGYVPLIKGDIEIECVDV